MNALFNKILNFEQRIIESIRIRVRRVINKILKKQDNSDNSNDNKMDWMQQLILGFIVQLFATLGIIIS